MEDATSAFTGTGVLGAASVYFLISDSIAQQQQPYSGRVQSIYSFRISSEDSYLFGGKY